MVRTERVGGYCTTLLKYDLPFHSDWVLECSPSQKQATEEATALLRRNLAISAVVCYSKIIAVDAWFSLVRARCRSGEIGIDRYFEQQISSAGSTDIAENTLDGIPIIWAYTPACKTGYILIECMLQHIGHDDGHSRNLMLSARLVMVK